MWEPDKQFPGKVFNVRVMNCLICVLFIIVIDVMMICTSAAFPAPLWNGLGVGGRGGGRRCASLAVEKVSRRRLILASKVFRGSHPRHLGE